MSSLQERRKGDQPNHTTDYSNLAGLEHIIEHIALQSFDRREVLTCWDRLEESTREKIRQWDIHGYIENIQTNFLGNSPDRDYDQINSLDLDYDQINPTLVAFQLVLPIHFARTCCARRHPVRAALDIFSSNFSVWDQ